MIFQPIPDFVLNLFLIYFVISTMIYGILILKIVLKVWPRVKKVKIPKLEEVNTKEKEEQKQDETELELPELE